MDHRVMRHFLSGHYFDDFITAGKLHSEECQTNLVLLIEICDLFGFPMASDKCEGPTTCLILLGVKLDTINPETPHREASSTKGHTPEMGSFVVLP